MVKRDMPVKTAASILALVGGNISVRTMGRTRHVAGLDVGSIIAPGTVVSVEARGGRLLVDDAGHA